MMKKVFRLTLVAALLVCGGMATTASAQKFGYVNSSEVVMSLPEVKDVQANLAKLEDEIMAQIDEMRVEGNKKVEDLQKNGSTMSESIRQIRQQEIETISQRINEIYSKAEEDISAEQQKLMAPIIEKARTAVEEVMKAQGLAGVFEAQVLVAIDKSLMVDVTPLVKKHLGIAE